MSYILEALKKAQAERQLGATPTIHAPALDTQAAQGGAPLKKPLVAALVALGFVSVGLAALLWRQVTQGPAASAPSSAPASAAAPTPTPAAAPAVATAPAPAPATAPATAAATAATPAPVVPKAAPEPAAPVAAPPVAATPPASAAVAAPQPERKRPDPAAEEPVQALRDLPEPIQRAIPPIAMSGYMYSSNPADRLILIDKVLRHEGDEVAPGLVLVRLEPKGAVFTFRGYRYRVPY